eukprot:PhF_6_TR35063/c0_g1_i1/m.51095
MSFRHSNRMIAVFENFLKTEECRRRIIKQHIRGRCSGVSVVCDAYCRVLSINIDDKSKYCDGNDVVTDRDGLCAAVRGAVYDATNKLHQLKISELKRVGEVKNVMSQYPDQIFDVLMQRPHAYEALTSSQHAPVPSWLATMRAHKAEFEGVTSVQHMMGNYLLNVMDKDRCVEVQRQAMAKEEVAFWNRVDLMRKAQRNSLGNTLKHRRTYRDFDYAAKEAESTAQQTVGIGMKHLP